MKRAHASSGIPTPPLRYLIQQTGPQLAGVQEFPSFGAVMNDHSQGDSANPYSPLMCILLLLLVGAATQLNLQAIWF
jgi:hypothetical protein